MSSTQNEDGSAQVAGPFPSSLAMAILAGMAGGFTSPALIGRADELHRLGAILDRAEQSQPQLVLLAGDAGVGKTRLLAEFADRAAGHGVRVLVGGCVELGDIGLAYLPVVDALRGLAEDPAEAELLAEVALIAPGLRRLLPGVAGPAPTDGQAEVGLDQLQVLDAVRAVLLGCAERSAVLMVLEDLHWADRATRDLVAFLARTLRSGRVLLVASYRSDELHRRHPLRPLLAELVRLPGVERIELAPFSRAELAEHLEAIPGVALPAELVERIYARSEGNPFFAEQLVAAGAGDAQLVLPATLADVLLARIQALTEPAQQLLRAAAVAGRRVPHQLLAQVVGWSEPELEEALRTTIEAGVLMVDASTGTYAFRHALLQEAVYGVLLPSEQVRLHATYAALLAAAPEGAAAELAHHCLASNDLPGALAASVRAADESAAVLAPAEALRHLTGALKLWERVPDPAAITGTDRIDLTLRAAGAAAAAGEEPRAAALAQDAAAAVDATADPARAARAYERRGRYLLHAGQVEEALHAQASAVELVPAQPPTRLRGRVTAAMAQVLIDVGRPEEARGWCQEALAVARAVGSVDDEADALVTLGRIENYADPANARSLYAEGRTRAASVGNLEIEARALEELAWLDDELGNLAAAEAMFDEGAELAGRTGLGWSAFGIEMRCGQCLVRYKTGAWDACERLAAAIPEPVTTQKAAQWAAAALPVEIARGRASVDRRLRQLVALTGTDRYRDVEVAGLEAEHAIWQGNLDRGRSAIQRGLATTGTFHAVELPDLIAYLGWMCTKGLTVEAEYAERARVAGDAMALDDAVAVGGALLEQARAAAEQASRAGLARDVDLRGWHATAEAEWTRLQGHSDPTRWQHAVEAFSYGHVYAVAHCQWRLAEALLGYGDREPAIAVVQAAYQTAVRLGAVPLRGALEALARRGRLDLGAGMPAERTLAGLTPREVEVLRLLVAGRSNRQIAEQLFISGKTASVHVSNILAKLGVHSRLEAAATARRLGLDQPAQEGSAT
jgi:DNA-binding CsgD family transcriptional regulator/tetratricopeptide (TPR) repeat protein